MFSYGKKPKVENIKNCRIMLSSNCAVYGSKKSIYIKERDVSGFLTDLLNIKTVFEGISIIKNIV